MTVLVAPWLSALLEVGPEVDEEELAAKLAERLRLQPPSGASGREVMVRFAQQSQGAFTTPDDIVRAAFPPALDPVLAAEELGLRGATQLERVLRIAASELWISRGPQRASPERAPRVPAKTRERDDSADARLAALAAEAIAEAKGEKPPEPPAAPPPATRVASPPAVAAAPAATPPPAIQPAPLPPAAAPGGALTDSLGAQLSAAGPLITFFATVGVLTTFGFMVWVFGLVAGVWR